MNGLRRDPGGLELDLRITPRGARNQVLGIARERLRIKVTAPPVEGKANEAVINYVSELFAVPRSRVSILRGHRGRDKTVRIEPTPPVPEELEAIFNSTETGL